MKGAVRKLLRLRRLKEELARASLELESARLRRVELGTDVALQDVQMAGTGRNVALEKGDQDDFLICEAEREIGALRLVRLGDLRRHQAARIPPLSQKFLDSRVERRQAEALDASIERLAEKHQSRRDQAELDDWFRGARRREAMYGELRAGAGNGALAPDPGKPGRHV